MQWFRVDLKTSFAWLCLTNAPKLSESKNQAGLGKIILGQNPKLLWSLYIVLLYYMIYSKIYRGKLNFGAATWQDGCIMEVPCLNIG